MSVRSNLILLTVLAAVASCASAPSQINNVCAVFDQRDGWFDNWHSAAKKAESAYGIPMPILMATVRKESGFEARARPARTKLFGVIPWSRPSTAYGFSQALDGTWQQYQQETGKFSARRTSFADAVDFVGWYHSKSVSINGVARNDAYALYLNYYFGWTAYGRGDWRSSKGMRDYARQTAEMAERYQAQLAGCNML